MIIDCISDLHGFFPKLKGGDLLIVAGDLTAGDTEKEYIHVYEWLRLQDYDRKIVIAGNHDNWIQKNCEPSPFPPGAPGLDTSPEYLCDSGTEFEGLKIWGSPWTKTFEGMNPRCMAFTLDTEEELAEKFEKIPLDTDILITHSPSYGVGDYVDEYRGHVGSEALMERVSKLKNLKLHVFGHIHEGHGLTAGLFANASHVDEHYRPVKKPIRVVF